MTTRPASLASRIGAHLAANPDQRFRAFEIAKALDVTTQRAASELGRMFREGKIERVHERVQGRALPIAYFQFPSPSTPHHI